MVAIVAVATTLQTIARAFFGRLGRGSADARELEALRDDVAQLRADVEGVQARLGNVDEIENRLDFAERLLGQVRERGLLNPPKER